MGRDLEPAARVVTKLSWLRLGPPIAVALAAFAAARVAMLPGVAFWDTGELQTVGPVLGTAHPTGFPTYVLLGWLASVVLQPFGEPAFRMNLLSALCLAAAAGLTVDLVRALTRSTILGVLAGLGLSLTPVAWAIGTHAEAHALHLVLVVLLLRLLLAWESRVRTDGGCVHRGVDRGDRYLVAAAVVFGLAVGNHSLALLLAPAVGLYVLAVNPRIWRRGRFVLGCAAALGITVVLVYLELPLRAGLFRAALVYGRPDTWDGFWYVTLGEQFRGSLVDPFGELPRKFGELVERTVAQFGPLAPLIPIGFLATVVRRPRYALLTMTALALACFFAASYVNADIGRYYLGPVLIAWTWLAVLAGVAVELLTALLDERDLHIAGPNRARAPLAVLVTLALLTPTLLDIPTRFAAVDESPDRSAANWVDHALAIMKPDALIVSWWSYSTPLWYAQRVEGRRPDLTIVDDRTRLDEGLGDITDVIDANLGLRPVYVIRSDPDEIALLAERYQLDPIDGVDARDLTRVVARRAPGS
jgi:Protein of unknown function (DUF2723).